MSAVEVDFYLQELHPKQQFIINHARRFNHLRCGRRFGKTTLIEELSSIALDGKRVGIWFPTYKDLSEVWKDLKRLYKPVTSSVNDHVQYNIISRKDETLKQIELITGGLIDCWSMDNPDSGQGRKYHRAIIDEAAKADNLYTSWENTIRPTLTDYKGDAFIMSRPKGKNNPFYKMEEKHREFDNWAFFHFTTYANPHIDPSEVDEAKSQLDDINFRQEYMAEYVDANDRPYLYAFDEARHVSPETYTPNRHLPLLITFDFNKDPMTACVGQQLDDMRAIIFDEIELMSGSTPEVCDQLKAKYPGWDGMMDVTGDATGHNRSPLVMGNLNHYRIIKSALGLKDYNLKVPKQNMGHKVSRILCNSVLQNAGFLITANCKRTIADMKAANVNEFGEIIKTQQEGRHFFDNSRYFIHACWPDFIKNPTKYRNSK